jgi:hypothetical protein
LLPFPALALLPPFVEFSENPLPWLSILLLLQLLSVLLLLPLLLLLLLLLPLLLPLLLYQLLLPLLLLLLPILRIGSGGE